MRVLNLVICAGGARLRSMSNLVFTAFGSFLLANLGVT